jgi:hypothetical protein
MTCSITDKDGEVAQLRREFEDLKQDTNRRFDALEQKFDLLIDALSPIIGDNVVATVKAGLKRKASGDDANHAKKKKYKRGEKSDE